MFHPDHITSLTDFQRNTAKYMKLIKKTKQPLLLTVRGKAKLIVSDPLTMAASQSGKLARTPKQIAARLKQSEEDEVTFAWEDVKAWLEERYLTKWRKAAKSSRRRAS